MQHRDERSEVPVCLSSKAAFANLHLLQVIQDLWGRPCE